MKKLFVLFVLIILLCGCMRNKIKESVKEMNEQIIGTKIEYIDQNNTIIGLYLDKGNRLELTKEYKTNFRSGMDVGVFSLFPSNDDEIYLKNGFGNDFYDAWTSLENYSNLKIGFNVKYTLSNGEEVSYNILDYNIIYKELYNYLYDDYANRNNSWYSHIEEDDYNENTLFTSIKLYGASIDDINSKIYFTVFTYDGLDDFDEEGNYRGNSFYTISICDIDKTC